MQGSSSHRRWYLFAAALAIAWLAHHAWRDHQDADAADPDAPSPATARATDRATIDRAAIGPNGARPRRAAILARLPRNVEGNVIVTGQVIERDGGPVGKVEIVFRSAAGEETTIAAVDGSYQIELAPGSYRAFVRDDGVLSVGMVERPRVPELPSADRANLPDESLMPIVLADHDLAGVDLAVVRGGAITGHVVDGAGHPIAGAVVRARRNPSHDTGPPVRPALGTDVAETDDAGAFELRVPRGGYVLEATHARYARNANGVAAIVEPGASATVEVVMTAGCTIAGRVVGPDGQPVGEGAIERKWGEGDHAYGPDGSIAADGTFRWVTTAEHDVTLRAWPWKSPPSPSRTFACREGARFEDVVFQLPAVGPDIDGVLVDASGAPVPLAFLDLAPLDPGGVAQQERSDASGAWGVFAMPAGRYRVTAHAPGRGFVSTVITAPVHGLRIALAPTGRIEGTLRVDRGSFEVQLLGCAGEDGRLDGERRLVAIDGGKFTVDHVPACAVRMRATWHDRIVTETVEVPPGGVGRVALELGPPRPRHVAGFVRDEAGRPVARATIRAIHEDGAQDTTADGNGYYELDTFVGAELTARGGDGAGFAVVAAGTDHLDLVVHAPDVDDGSFYYEIE